MWQFFLVFQANAIFAAALVLLQEYRLHQVPVWTFIPYTNQRFCGVLQFSAAKWGMLLPAPLMWNVFVWLVANDFASHKDWMFLAGFAFVFALLYLANGLSSRHKLNVFFPSPGKISLIGALNAFYLSLLFGANAVVLGNLMFLLDHALTILLFWAGGVALYIFLVILDFWRGRHDFIKFP